jgi:hypothetical protein
MTMTDPVIEELEMVAPGPREGEETETGERGGDPGETKRLNIKVNIAGGPPRDGEDTEEVQEGEAEARPVERLGVTTVAVAAGSRPC